MSREVPTECSQFQFGRSECKLFRQWDQYIREHEHEWRAVEPGNHTLAVEINTVTGSDYLRAETTFRIEWTPWEESRHCHLTNLSNTSAEPTYSHDP